MISKKKIKVLWLCSWYPNREHHYYGIFIKKQAAATNAFCEVSVLYAQESAVSTYEFNIKNSPFLQVIVYYPKSKFLLLKLIRHFSAILKGYNVITKSTGKPELLHVNVAFPMGVLALYLKFFYNIEYIISEHSSFYKKWLAGNIKYQFLAKIISKISLKYASTIVLLSKNHATVFKRLNLIQDFQVIPNVVDVHTFHLPLERRPFKKDKLQLLHVSSLYEPDKNVMGILRGVALLNKQRQDFELHIIGAEAYHADLKKYAYSLGLSDNSITFQSFIPESAVAEAMQSADIFILFSHFEGLPCVILEAMAVGLPVIATETGGISEWITPETGVLLKVGDEEGLVNAMNYVMDNRDKFAPSVIRSKIVDKCSVEVVGQAIVSVYEEVLNLNKKI